MRVCDMFKGGVLGCKEYVVEVWMDLRCNWFCYFFLEVSGVLLEFWFWEKGGWWWVLMNVMIVYWLK